MGCPPFRHHYQAEEATEGTHYWVVTMRCERPGCGKSKIKLPRARGVTYR